MEVGEDSYRLRSDEPEAHVRKAVWGIRVWVAVVLVEKIRSKPTSDLWGLGPGAHTVRR